MMDYIIAGLLCYLISKHNEQPLWCIPMAVCAAVVLAEIMKVVYP